MNKFDKYTHDDDLTTWEKRARDLVRAWKTLDACDREQFLEAFDSEDLAVLEAVLDMATEAIQ